MVSVKKRTVFNDITISTINQENASYFIKSSSYKDNTKSIFNGKRHVANNHNTILTKELEVFSNITISPGQSDGNESKSDTMTEYEDKLFDIMSAQEYSKDIFQYLYQLDKTNMLHTPQISKKEIINKETLINWIIKVHWQFGFLEETLYLTTYIIEKYQSLVNVSVDELQLLGISSLFIASKVEEIMIPRTIYYSLQTEGNCSVEDIITFEIRILKELQYDLSFANPMNFIRRLTKADDFDLSRRTIAKYLLEITIMDSKNFNQFPKSQCAAAAMFLSRKMFGKQSWGSKFVELSGGYLKRDIIFICKLLIKYLLSPITHLDFQTKYESTRFLRASIICKEWVLAIMKQQKMRKMGYKNNIRKY